MAQRRMTSLEVISTDAFLDMPQSSQLLYFHLNARADDDGFVANPKSIMRNCGSQGDDLKLLVAKKFLISFEDGVCVIKHWRINNYIRKDIYKETKYLNHKQTLFIRPTGAYTLTDDGRAVPVPNGHFQLEEVKPKQLENKGQNHVHETSTESALRLGKVRKGKANKGENKFSQDGAVLLKSFEEINPAIKRMYNNTTQRQACDDLIESYGFDRVKTVIEKTLPKTNAMEYMPTITTPHQLFLKWSNLEAGIRKLQSKTKKENKNVIW